MTYDEVLAEARKHIGTTCRACPVCNGLACGNTLPGPGSKAPGNGANDNYQAWQKIRLNMDTIAENIPADPACTLFGRAFSLPLLTGPIGSVARQFNPDTNVMDYNDAVFAASARCGVLPATATGSCRRCWSAASRARPASAATPSPSSTRMPTRIS